MTRKTTPARFIVTAALIAAGYAVLTVLSATLGLAFGNIQLRLSEALNILAVFTPAAIPGLMMGCILGNSLSPLGVVDVFVGAVATGLSAVGIRLIARYIKKGTAFWCIIPPTLFNSVLIGLEIALFLPNDGAGIGFLLATVEIAVGEIAICTALGVPIYYTVRKYTGRLI